MMHPSESQLALYAGQDLGRFATWRIARHLDHCLECRIAMRAFQHVSEELAAWNDVPPVAWNRLATEMQANIRLGLAAGECVRAADAQPFAWISAARTLAVCASVIALVAAGLFLQRPAPAPRAIATGNAVLRATANAIELNQDGQTLSLLHVHSTQVSYSAGAQGSMRAGYVDSDTGNVTINDVYVQ